MCSHSVYVRAHLNWDGVAIGELEPLVPVGVDGLGGAGGVEFGDLVFGEVPADGGEILAELFFVAGAHDDVGYGGALQEPVQGNLRNALARFFRDFLDSVHNLIEIFVFDLGAGFGGFVQAGDFGNRASAADFAGKTSPTEGAPDKRADFLIESERHQLPFIFAADEGVVDLMADVAGPAVTLGNRERLHEMPAGKIGAGDVADFAAFDEGVERFESFFDGREGVEGMHVVDVDVIDAEAAEAVFAGLDQMMTGGAEVVRAVAHGEGGFRGNEDAITFVGDGFAKDFFGEAAGIDVSGVKEIDSGVEADVDEARGFRNVAGAPGFEEFVAAAERAGAETQNGNLETGMAELSEFHGGLDARRKAEDTRARRELELERAEDKDCRFIALGRA